MKITVKIYIPSNFINISTIRSHLLSLIKESFKASDSDQSFYEYFYNSHQSNIKKPFTFSFKFSDSPEKFNDTIDRYISITFSTNSYDFLTHFYNGLNILTKKEFKFLGSPLKIKSIKYHPARNIVADTINFYTVGYFLLRYPKDGDYYVIPENAKIVSSKLSNTHNIPWKYWKVVTADEFKQILLLHLRSHTSDEEIKVRFVEVELVRPIAHRSANPEHPFKITLPGMKAKFQFSAKPSTLNFLYDVGIGARRSEGFGLLEIF